MEKHKESNKEAEDTESLKLFHERKIQKRREWPMRGHT
jgi:hypothetical protein